MYLNCSGFVCAVVSNRYPESGQNIYILWCCNGCCNTAFTSITAKNSSICPEGTRSYHHLMAIEQAGPAVIGVDDTDGRNRVAVKRVRKPEGSVYQVQPSTCDQIVNIRDIYVENGNIIFII